MRWQCRRTEGAVAVRWPAIEAVAAALLAEKTLDLKRLRELILATKPAAPTCD